MSAVIGKQVSNPVVSVARPWQRLLQTMVVLLFGWSWLWLQCAAGGGEYAEWMGKYGALLLMSVSGALVLRCLWRRNILFSLVFAYIALYAFVVRYPVFHGIGLSGHQPMPYPETLFQTMQIFSLFLICVYVVLRVQSPERIYIPKFRRDDVVYGICMLVAFLIFLFGKTGTSLLSGEGYGDIEKNASSFNEYIIIFFMAAYLFSGGERKRLALLYALAGVFCIKNLLFGGRIETVLVFLWFFIVKLQHVLSVKQMLILLVLGVWGMETVNNIRQNPLVLLTDEWLNVFLPWHVGDMPERACLASNEGDVFWAGQRILQLIRDGVLSWNERCSAAVNYLLSSVTPFSWLGPTANLSSYRTDVYSTGGGGLAPAFAYAFLSYPGVMVLGIFFARCLNKLYEKSLKEWQYVYIVLLIVTLPRWFAYYPVHIVKYCLWGTGAYLFFTALDYTLKKRKMPNIRS